jgi:hypothetical protein
VRRWIPLALCLCAAGCGVNDKIGDTCTLTVRDKAGKTVLTTEALQLRRLREAALSEVYYTWTDKAGRHYSLVPLTTDTVDVSGTTKGQ